LGEFLAIASIVMCLLSILVDLGQPMRALERLLYPTPNSVLFYDAIVLNGYLFLNLVVGWNVLEAERNGVHYQSWLKPLIYLFDSLGHQHPHRYRLSLLRPARASLLAHGHSGAALSGLGLCRRAGPADPAVPVHPQGSPISIPGKEQIQTLAKTVAYAICINVFFFSVRGFRGFYSNIPGHMDHIKYLFVGLHGHGAWCPGCGPP
jgi:hypothetical protein